MRQRIGTFRLLKPQVYTRHYECAAWGTEITVQPGDYEIQAEVQDDGTVKDFFGPACVLPGIITHSWFPSLFCGNRIPGTDPNVDKDVGKPDNYVLDWYAHGMAYALLEGRRGDGAEVILDEPFAPTYVNFDYDDRPCQTAKIVDKRVYAGPIVLEKLEEKA